MKETLDLGEIAIVLVAQNNNPTILNPDFLKYNHIVPENWTLKKKPVCIDVMAQVSFDNGIQITAELNKIIFFESMKGKQNLNEIKIHEIAAKYIKILPHINYLAVGVNPKGHIPFQTENDTQIFIRDKFTNINLWQRFDNNPINMGFKFSYEVEKVLMSFSIEASHYNVLPGKTVPVVSFAGNFNHKVIGETTDNKIENLISIINDWDKDIQTYREFVNKMIGGNLECLH